MRQQKWELYIDGLQGHPSVCQSSHTVEGMKFLAEAIPPEEFPKLLNIGAGEGLETYVLKQLGYDVTGIINGKINLEYATTNFPDTKFVEAEMHDLPFPSESFDAIYMNQTFEHSYAPFIFLLEMYCVLKPKGRIWTAMPEFKEYNDPGIGDSNRITPHHPNNLCYNILHQMFKETGFKIVYCTSVKESPYFDNPYLLEKQPMETMHSDVQTIIYKRRMVFG